MVPGEAAKQNTGASVELGGTVGSTGSGVTLQVVTLNALHNQIPELQVFALVGW